MDRWQILGAFVVAGFGALAFLRIVGNELVVKHQGVELRVERDRSERVRHAEEAARNQLQQDLEKQKVG